ncbi:MAG: CAP domain-containing protein [Nannocystaceae bacterium]
MTTRPALALALALVAVLACRKDMSQGIHDPSPSSTPSSARPVGDPPPTEVEPGDTTTPTPAPESGRSSTGTRAPAGPRPSAGGSTGASTPAPSGDPEPDRLAGLTAAHNRIRGDLGLPPLTWSPEIARYAQAWADKLQQKGCGLRHRPDSGPDAERYGENIFSMTGADPSAAEVVDTWAAEVAGYDVKTNRCRGVCGHYTQVVWRKSQRLGCGMASCGDTEVWVCNYDPPGNFIGERPY